MNLFTVDYYCTWDEVTESGCIMYWRFNFSVTKDGYGIWVYCNMLSVKPTEKQIRKFKQQCYRASNKWFKNEEVLNEIKNTHEKR